MNDIPAPSAAELLTVEDLIAYTETDIALPMLSKAAGKAKRLRARKIGRSEYLSLLPPFPPEAEEWPQAELAEREREWLATLPDDQRQARRVALRDVLYQVVALASLAPTLTVEQARRLGEDATAAAADILRFSGLLPQEPIEADPAARAPAPEETPAHDVAEEVGAA